MTRQRLLEIILAVVAVVFIPGYLINLYLSHRYASAISNAPASDPQYDAAFKAGVALEENKQYEQAIPKFLEAEMYATKMQVAKYPSLEAAIEHYVSCNLALGRDDTVHAASKQLIRTLFEDGESLQKSGQLEASVAKFQEVEERAQGFDDFEVPIVDLARERLVEAFWKLKRRSDMDAVLDRKIASVRQPLNDYDSALGQEYYKIAMWLSNLQDWDGLEKACTQAIVEYDKTIGTYPEYDSSGKSLTGNARFAKAMMMYWLAAAYARQGKNEPALRAADDAFQYNATLHSSPQLGREIADLGLQVAKAANQPAQMDEWQKRRNALPPDPCPAPNINNPSCITPATPAIPTQTTR